MVHRAILGSIERMLAILTEHTGGKWPMWLSPRQVMVVPVSDRHAGYAARVASSLHAAGLYAEADLSGRTMQRKIREAQLQQFNYLLAVGAREEEDGTVSVRRRGGELVGVKPAAEFAAEALREARPPLSTT